MYRSVSQFSRGFVQGEHDTDQGLELVAQIGPPRIPCSKCLESLHLLLQHADDLLDRGAVGDSDYDAPVVKLRARFLFVCVHRFGPDVLKADIRHRYGVVRSVVVKCKK